MYVFTAPSPHGFVWWRVRGRVPRLRVTIETAHLTPPSCDWGKLRARWRAARAVPAGASTLSREGFPGTVRRADQKARTDRGSGRRGLVPASIRSARRSSRRPPRCGWPEHESTDDAAMEMSQLLCLQVLIAEDISLEDVYRHL